MLENEGGHLRILIANERRDRLELLAQVVTGLGHEVIARSVDVREVAAVTEPEQPCVALVGPGASSDHGPDLLSEIVRAAARPCPTGCAADSLLVSPTAVVGPRRGIPR